MEHIERNTAAVDDVHDDDNAVGGDGDAAAAANMPDVEGDYEEELEMLASSPISSASSNSSNHSNIEYANYNEGAIRILEPCVVHYPDVATSYLAGLNRRDTQHRISMLVCNTLPVD